MSEVREKQLWVDGDGIPVLITSVFTTLSKKVELKRLGRTGHAQLTDFLFEYKPLEL